MDSRSHFLCHTSAFDTQDCKSFDIEGIALFVVSRDQGYFAYLNQCPHQRVPLDWGNEQFLDLDGELIQCASHGALFAIESGLCLSGPCAGEALTPVKLSVVDGALHAHFTS